MDVKDLLNNEESSKPNKRKNKPRKPLKIPKNKTKLAALGGLVSVLLVLGFIIFNNPAILSNLIGGSISHAFNAGNGLTTETGTVEGNTIVLAPGDTQTGPNRVMAPGNYTILFEGSGFDAENITITIEGNEIDLTEADITDDRIEFEVELVGTDPINVMLTNNREYNEAESDEYGIDPNYLITIERLTISTVPEPITIGSLFRIDPTPTTTPSAPTAPMAPSPALAALPAATNVTAGNLPSGRINNQNGNPITNEDRLNEWTLGPSGDRLNFRTGTRTNFATTASREHNRLTAFALATFGPQQFNNTRGIVTGLVDYMQPGAIAVANRIPHQHSFTPRFITGSGGTVIEPIGAASFRFPCANLTPNPISANRLCFSTHNQNFNTARGVRYRNVGINPATGRVVDMEFIIRGVTPNRPTPSGGQTAAVANSQRSINFYHTAIGFSTRGTAAVRFDIRFVDHITGQPLSNLRGNLSHQDIDAVQGLGIQRARIPANPTAGRPSMWFANSGTTNRANYNNVTYPSGTMIRARNGVTFGTGGGTANNPFLFYFSSHGYGTDHSRCTNNTNAVNRHSCVGTRGNANRCGANVGSSSRQSPSTFFDNCVGWNPRTMFTQLFQTDSTGILQKYWAYNSGATNTNQALYMHGFPIVPVEVPAPFKRLTGGTITANTNDAENTLSHRYQRYTYEVTAYMPYTVPNHRMQRFVITDVLPNELRVVPGTTPRVYHERTNNPVPANHFNIAVSGQTVTATATGALNQHHGRTYTLRIQVEVRPGHTLTNRCTGIVRSMPAGATCIPNTASISYTTGTGTRAHTGNRNSNTTRTVVLPPPATPTPTKTVSGGTINNAPTNTQNTLAGRHQEFEFRVATGTIPTRTAGYFFSAFEIRDQINPVLQVNTSGIRVMSGTENVTSWFDISVSENNLVRAVARADRLNQAAFYGRSYVLHIPVQVRTGANLTNCTAPHPTTNFCIPNTGSIRYTMLGRTNDRNTNNTTTIITPPPVTPAPTKTVSGGTLATYGGVANAQNTLPGRYEPFEFRVSANVPTRHPSYFFSAFVIRDEINSALQINGTGNAIGTATGIRVMSGTTNVSSRFNIEVNGQIVTATARANYLSQASFYGQTYVLHIPVQVRAGTNLTPATFNCGTPATPTGSRCIPNTGSISYTVSGSSNNRNSNNTRTIITPPPVTPAPTKTVSGGVITPGSNNRENTLPGRFEPFEFRVTANLPVRHASYFFTSMEIIDDVVPELNVGSPVIRTGGNIVPTCNPEVPETVTPACVFYITLEEVTEGENQGHTRVRAVARANHLNQASFYGRTYVLHIPVQVHEGADLSRFRGDDGNYHIPNIGRLNYTMLGRPDGNNTPPTNTVIEPPPPSPEPIKTVTGGTNETPQKNILANRYEPFEFQISTYVSARHSSYFFRAFEILDDIVPELDIRNTRMTANDQDIATCTPAEETSDCVFIITIEDNEVRARARAEHLSRASFYGRTYVLHIEVVVRDGADLTRFLNEADNTFVIPNEGRVRYTILGREIEEVPTPPTETVIIRPILTVVKTSEEHEVTINEIVNYRVEVSQTREGATARNVVITDVLPDAIRLLPNTVRVQMRTMETQQPVVPEGEENDETTQTPPQVGPPRVVYRDIEGVVITTNNNTIVVRVPSIAYRETVVITYRATTLRPGSHTNVVTVVNPDTPDLEDDNTIRVDRIMNPQTGLVAGISLIVSAIGVSLVATILVTKYIRKNDIITD